MKAMRIVLVLTYVVLVFLLLLGLLFNACRSCSLPDLPNIEGGNDEPPAEEEVIDEALNVGQDGQLKVTLLWNFNADIDLHVIEPNGNEIYFNHKRSSTGGYLDVDNVDGGRGSAENIFWENPPTGNYKVQLVYYSKGNQAPTSGTCKVVVFNKDQEPQVYTVQMNESQRRDVVDVTTVQFR